MSRRANPWGLAFILSAALWAGLAFIILTLVEVTP